MIEVEEEIIEEMVQMEVNNEEAVEMVKNNKHNCITTTYYLLQKKR